MGLLDKIFQAAAESDPQFGNFLKAHAPGGSQNGTPGGGWPSAPQYPQWQPGYNPFSSGSGNFYNGGLQQRGVTDSRPAAWNAFAPTAQLPFPVAKQPPTLHAAQPANIQGMWRGGMGMGGPFGQQWDISFGGGPWQQPKAGGTYSNPWSDQGQGPSKFPGGR